METIGTNLDKIIERGKCVYELSWDTGAPGRGASCERVYFFAGSYYVLLDDEEALESYPTLQEAIAATEQLYRIGPATTQIESADLSIDQIISLLEPFDGLEESTFRLRINGAIRVIVGR